MLGSKIAHKSARITHPMTPTKREPSPEANGKTKVPKYDDTVRNLVPDDRKIRKLIIF